MCPQRIVSCFPTDSWSSMWASFLHFKALFIQVASSRPSLPVAFISQGCVYCPWASGEVWAMPAVLGKSLHRIRGDSSDSIWHADVLRTHVELQFRPWKDTANILETIASMRRLIITRVSWKFKDISVVSDAQRHRAKLDAEYNRGRGNFGEEGGVFVGEDEPAVMNCLQLHAYWN